MGLKHDPFAAEEARLPAADWVPADDAFDPGAMAPPTMMTAPLALAASIRNQRPDCPQGSRRRRSSGAIRRPSRRGAGSTADTSSVAMSRQPLRPAASARAV